MLVQDQWGLCARVVAQFLFKAKSLGRAKEPCKQAARADTVHLRSGLEYSRTHVFFIFLST